MLSLAFSHNSESLRVLKKETLEKIVPIVEGVKELDAIAPVNHITGDRMNVLDLINLVLSPDRKDLLKKFLQDVPTAQSLTQLDDESAIQLLRDRTSSGYPADDDLFAKKMASIADIALPALREMASKASSKSSSETIEFNESDAPASE